MLDTLLMRLGMKRPQPRAVQTTQPFQAISIFHGTVCCAAAKQASEIRFLSSKAPPLPLAECTMRGTCKCQYIKHRDRRGDARRLTDFGLKQQLFSARERRLKRGRRQRD